MNSTIQAVLDASLPNQENFKNPYTRNSIIIFITLIITQLLIIFIGKFLWNNILIELFPQSVVEATSIWQIWGLQILIRLLVGN